MDRKREREGKRILNYKGLLTQYQNLRYLAEGIQSTVWEKRINVSTCMVASYIIMVERKYTIGPKKNNWVWKVTGQILLNAGTQPAGSYTFTFVRNWK